MISSRARSIFACVGLLLSSSATAQQTVKIDDAYVYSLANPNGIQYSAEGWTTVNVDNIDLRYDDTYTWSQTPGSNLVYFFRGTEIAHYADMGPNHGIVGVAIDGYPYTNFTSATNGSTIRYQQQIWNFTGLSEGDHQVVISNVDAGNPATSIIGVDYLEVTLGSDGSIIPASSGPGASVIPSTAVLVDDSSDMISYSGSWDTYYSDINDGVYFGGTEHESTSPGSMLTFKFNGTAVWYFCDQYENNTVVSISIDGGPADMVNTASPTGIWLTQILIWSKTGLTDGPHTLTITHAGLEGTFAGVDFFEYVPSEKNVSASKSTRVGAIVGGAVAGVALAVFIAGFLTWRLKRKPPQDTTVPAHETYGGAAAYGAGGKAVPVQPSSMYSPSRLGTPGFTPEMGNQYQAMPMPETQNLGAASIAPTTWTGVTYTGYPEI